MSTDLANKRCRACEGGVEPLSQAAATNLLSQLQGWELRDQKIQKGFRFKDFVEAMRFVNRIAAVAQSEGHHPDIEIHYNQVTLTLWTHALGGLSANDFITAAKIDAL